jgi:hypothetical protein
MVHIKTMCGRIIQASVPLRYQLVDGLDVPDSRLSNIPRRYNGAPSQELLVIRQNHQTGERSLDLLKWGLVPSWNGDPKGGPARASLAFRATRSRCNVTFRPRNAVTNSTPRVYGLHWMLNIVTGEVGDAAASLFAAEIRSASYQPPVAKTPLAGADAGTRR